MRWIILIVMMFSRCTLAAAHPQGAYAKGLLMIPAIQLIATVQEIPAQADGSYDLTTLGDGIGWLQYSAWLEHDFGRIDLVGHTPGGFERVHELAVGDLIIVADRGRVEWYRVELSVVVEVSDVSWLLQDGPERVVLITCEGDQRRVVQARRIA